MRPTSSFLSHNIACLISQYYTITITNTITLLHVSCTCNISILHVHVHATPVLAHVRSLLTCSALLSPFSSPEDDSLLFIRYIEVWLDQTLSYSYFTHLNYLFLSCLFISPFLWSLCDSFISLTPFRSSQTLSPDSFRFLCSSPLISFSFPVLRLLVCSFLCNFISLLRHRLSV